MTLQHLLDWIPAGLLAGLGVTGWIARDNKTKLEKHIEQDDALHADMIDRLARIETKLDDLRGNHGNRTY